jgi:hypothetical protein
MKTPLETFEAWLLSTAGRSDELGWRFHPIPEEISAPFEKQRRAFDRRKGELPRLLLPNKNLQLYADFIDDGTCNAAADIFDDLGVIGLNKGAIMLPLEIFFNMFSHPEVLPGIGQSREERINWRHSEGLPKNYDTLVLDREAARRLKWPKGPNCSRRHEVAELCAEIAWSFIMLHEVVHIVHGHIGYIRRFIPAARIIRANSGPVQLPQPELDLQAIELWADAKAIAGSLGGFLTKSWASILLTVFPKPEDKVFIWSFAIYTLFRIWELKTDTSNLWGTHPPNVLRFQMALEGAAAIAISLVPSLGNGVFQQAVGAGMQQAERAIVFCGGKRLVPEEAAGTNDPKVAAHCAMLADHHDNVLLRELPAYSYIELKTTIPNPVLATD